MIGDGIGFGIGQIFKFFSVRTETFDKRKGSKAIQAAEDYIRRNNSIGPRNDGKLKKYEKRFWKYNN